MQAEGRELDALKKKQTIKSTGADNPDSWSAVASDMWGSQQTYQKDLPKPKCTEDK